MTRAETGNQIPDNEQVPKLIDRRYQVDRLLNSGGMASVYRGLDLRLERDVAIKIMHPHLAYDQRLLSRFEVEARSAARLQHPNIVQVYDQGVWRGRAFLVMEFVNGPNLRQLLMERGCFPVEEALTFLIEILSGLALAHSAQIIHRDIKPENVIMAPDKTLKVADFGLAHALHQATGNTTGTVMGTVAYLAPELITGQSSNSQCDIYACGMMLYEILTGQPLLLGETGIQTAWKHVNDPFPVLTKSDPWLPTPVAKLIMEFCASDPQDRPASAISALEQAQQILEQLSVAEKKVCCPQPKIILSVAKQNQKTTLDEQRPVTGTVTGEVKTSLLPALPPLPASSAPRNKTAIPNTSNIIPEGEAPAATEPAPASTSAPVPPRKRHWLGWILALLSCLLVAAGVSGWWFWYGPGAKIPLPNLIGKTQVQAQTELQKLHLKPQFEQVFSDQIPAGKVISTKPNKSQKVYPETTVKVLLSKGIEYVAVPELGNIDLEAARTALTKAKLKIGQIEYSFSEEVAKDKIIDQSLNAGEKVKHDTTVDLVVSKGREPLTVPELVGKQFQSAAQELKEKGLLLTSTEVFDDEIPKGEIIKQLVKNGEIRYRGDQIEVVVSKGPELIAVPNVVGATVDNAKKQLQALGFTVSDQARLPGFKVYRVYSQSIKGGTKAPKGSKITIYYI